MIPYSMNVSVVNAIIMRNLLSATTTRLTNWYL